MVDERKEYQEKIANHVSHRNDVRLIFLDGWYSLGALRNISIATSYKSPPPYTVVAFIANAAGVYNGVSYIEGEVIIAVMGGIGTLPSFYLDTSGNLIVDSPDAANYSIDANGNLTYTN